MEGNKSCRLDRTSQKGYFKILSFNVADPDADPPAGSGTLLVETDPNPPITLEYLDWLNQLLGTPYKNNDLRHNKYSTSALAPVMYQ
jgi:hypothetical protein